MPLIVAQLSEVGVVIHIYYSRRIARQSQERYAGIITVPNVHSTSAGHPTKHFPQKGSYNSAVGKYGDSAAFILPGDIHNSRVEPPPGVDTRLAHFDTPIVRIGHESGVLTGIALKYLAPLHILPNAEIYFSEIIPQDDGNTMSLANYLTSSAGTQQRAGICFVDFNRAEAFLRRLRLPDTLCRKTAFCYAERPAIEISFSLAVANKINISAHRSLEICTNFPFLIVRLFARFSNIFS